MKRPLVLLFRPGVAVLSLMPLVTGSSRAHTLPISLPVPVPDEAYLHLELTLHPFELTFFPDLDTNRNGRLDPAEGDAKSTPARGNDRRQKSNLPARLHGGGILFLSICLASGLVASAAAAHPPAILVPQEASGGEVLAAREVRRYVFLRTGTLLPIERTVDTVPAGNAIAVAERHRPLALAVGRLAGGEKQLASLAAQEFWLKSVEAKGRRILLITGGDDIGVLYGAYRFAEGLGVRFYLDGDVIPDERVQLAWPDLDEHAQPLFALRGIQPFHDFPEGPDLWNRDDYLAIISQLPKLRMNFIGLHTYPEGVPNAEPTVWIGLAEDVEPDGSVRFSYPASYQNTRRGNWGYQANLTSEFSFGAAQLFEAEDYGPEVMGGSFPAPQSLTECNEVFNRTAALLRAAFEHAHQLGVKTCVGTETPLTVPKTVRERLATQAAASPDAGSGPAPRSAAERHDEPPLAPAVIQEIYQGIFTRAARAYPLDYYWFWTPESWTWKGTKAEQITATTNDLFAAIAAHRQTRPPFQLATCGWVLGPQQDRALFDQVLPKDMPVSCINREVGKTPVDKAFAPVAGRSKWAIPWLEDDPALTSPQLWAGRMRRDARDALRYGCDGLMGIHWRTRVLGPAVSALAQAAWTQAGWTNSTTELDPRSAANLSVPGSMPDGNRANEEATPHDSAPEARPTPPPQPPIPSTADFYDDWANHQFGPEIGAAAAGIFQAIDGQLPRPADWVEGPGGIRPDPRGWDQVRADYAFVDHLAALRPRVQGAGNQARFAWWLHTFQYQRAMARVNCTWALYTNAFAKVKAASDEAAKQSAARETLLPLRRQLVSEVGEVYEHLLATVGNPGELGTVANWEQHLLPALLTRPGKELAAMTGQPLPEDARPGKAYHGPTRVFVPTTRSSYVVGETLALKVIVLSDPPPREATLCWRPMGRGVFQSLPLGHVARGVYRVEFPGDATASNDLEYYIRIQPEQGEAVFFPATAPELNQTLVATPLREERVTKARVP